jgi:hypothetical protein
METGFPPQNTPTPSARKTASIDATETKNNDSPNQVTLYDFVFGFLWISSFLSFLVSLSKKIPDVDWKSLMNRSSFAPSQSGRDSPSLSGEG